MKMQKLCMVVWRNFLFRRRQWLLTFLEVVMPSVMFMAVALVHSVEYNRVELERNNNSLHGTTILFTPRNWFTARMMRHVEKSLHVGMKSFKNEKLLMNFYTLLDRERWHTYGVIFESLPSGGGIPQNLTYKICMNQEEAEFLAPKLRNTEAAYWLRNIPDVSLHPHFVAIQMALDRAYINMAKPDYKSPKIILQQELSPGVVQVTSSANHKLLEMLLVLSMTVLTVSVLMKLVHEKESGLKELMKIMGLPSRMLLISWILDFLIVNMVTMSIVTTCLVTHWNEAAPIIANVNVLLLWTFLVLYGAASTTFCFLLSTFFSQTKVAVSIGVVLWYLSYFLPQKMVYGSVMRLLSCMLPNMAMSWGFTIIFALQKQGIHMTWSNILTPAGSISGDMCMACVFSMLFADIVLFTLATLYLEAVWPNKYGACRPWYFIFIPSCWTGTRSLSGNKGVSAGIKMQDFGKVFTSFCRLHTKVAVDGITADICKGDITVLLGLNGSGKSTIISTVTGVMHPTSGAVYVDGYDIRERPPEGIGVCFQDNLCFPELTVLQHLIFFAVLKGVPIVRAREEAYSYAIKLRLVEKSNKLFTELSAGQRRKLALGIAVVGNPKILVLDEPTLGMDPEAKREVWDVLLGMRGLHRTTLVTTHDAEEADVLGDRVAILDRGRVQCYGTASYLKKIYGNSFKLTLMQKQGVTQIQDTVEHCVLGAKCYSEKSSLQVFSLPAECSAQFPELFDQLEQNRQALGIESIGIASTTLEDVLLRVGKTLEDEQNVPKSPDSTDTATIVGSSDELEFKKKVGTELQRMHITALFIKKTIFTCRNWLHFLLHVLLITLTIVPLIVTLNVNYYPRLQFPRLLSLRDYGPIEVICEAQPGADMALVKKYKTLVMSNSSEGRFVNSSIPTEAFIEVEFSKNAVNVFCTQETAGVAVNFVSNAILLPQHSITVMSQPFSKHKKPGKLLDMIPDVGPLMLLPLCLQFVVQSCVIFPLLERVSGVKHLQTMTGVKSIVYWVSCFTVDILLYLTICIIVLEVLALAGSSVHLIMGLRDLGPYLLLFFLFACAGIPYTYLLSHLNKMAIYSASVICLLSIFQGLIVPVALFIITSSSTSEYAFIGTFLRYLFEFCPPCAFMLGYTSLVDQYYSNSKCRAFHSMKFSCHSSLELQDICCCEGVSCQKSYLGFPNKGNPRGIGEELMFLAADTVLYWALLLAFESKLLYRVRRKMLHHTSSQAQVLDIDVMKEQDKIKTKVSGLPLQPNEDDLLVHKLMKKYCNMNVPAVKGVSFSVGPGQCFGLLGVNGAGKTSILRTIVGQDCPNDGDVWVTQWKLSSSDMEYYSQLGYCPEADSFNEHLTGREMMQLFARLRGIPGEWERNHEVNKWLMYFGLQEVANQQCSTYSCSNRRKLNFALATIGEPRLMILDDPTNGIDIVAKRNIWNVVTALRNSGQSILITSQSMAECEALCTRIGIMVSGQLVCLGDLAHIRKSFGQGIIIIIKLRLLGTDELQVTRLKEAFEEYLRPNCVLRSERQGYLHYHVLELNTSWKLLFTFMEHIKHDHNIVEHYSISETSRLNDAFLSFAKIEPRYIDDITNI